MEEEEEDDDDNDMCAHYFAVDILASDGCQVTQQLWTYSTSRFAL